MNSKFERTARGLALNLIGIQGARRCERTIKRAPGIYARDEARKLLSSSIKQSNRTSDCMRASMEPCHYSKKAPFHLHFCAIFSRFNSAFFIQYSALLFFKGTPGYKKKLILIDSR